MKLPVGTVIRAQAILFDMDGTLVDSTRAVEHVWSRWADRHALSSDMVLHTIHGVRITDSAKNLTPAGADIDRGTATLIAEEREQLEGISAIPGSVELLARLPSQSWAVVTSADRA
ncbi:MAG: HAD hydrolase-like protein, partial [Alphaproteobacteria bacterium]|nr:HAD hydrolase-like protein [Alphaproteobacteria bacterium]